MKQNPGELCVQNKVITVSFTLPFSLLQSRFYFENLLRGDYLHQRIITFYDQENLGTPFMVYCLLLRGFFIGILLVDIFKVSVHTTGLLAVHYPTYKYFTFFSYAYIRNMKKQILLFKGPGSFTKKF